MIYYKKNREVVRDSEIDDISHIARHMRKSDMREIWSSHNILPEDALKKGFSQSVKCLTILKNDVPLAMFGIVPYEILGKFAGIWMLATDDLDRVSFKFAKHSRKFIEIFLDLYPILVNHVDKRNSKSVKWLKLCGAQMGPCIPYGVEKKLFYPFSIRRNHV